MEMAESATSENRPRVFPVTQWTAVLAAGGTPSPESAAALERLCSSYWYPLYALVRRSGHSPPDAEDLTPELRIRSEARPRQVPAGARPPEVARTTEPGPFPMKPPRGGPFRARSSTGGLPIQPRQGGGSVLRCWSGRPRRAAPAGGLARLGSPRPATFHYQRNQCGRRGVPTARGSGHSRQAKMKPPRSDPNGGCGPVAGKPAAWVARWPQPRWG